MENKIYKKYTITLPKELGKEFKQFCEDNGLSISGRIAILVKDDLKSKSLKSKSD